MVDIAGPLTRPLGPLPVWGWAALGGGALFLFTARHNPGSAASAVVNPNVAVPAPPGGGSTGGGSTGGGSTGGGSTGGGSTGGGSTGGGDSGTAPGITAKDLFGGGTLGDFLKGLGPNYQNFQFAEGNSSVGVQNSAQNILDEQQFETTAAASVQNQKNAYDYNLGVMTQNQNYLLGSQQQAYGYNLAAMIAQQNAALAGQGHAIPAGYQFGGGTSGLAYSQPAANPVQAPGNPTPPPSGPQCPSGNFSCIRYACDKGNFGCADAAAPWVRGKENQIWG